MKFVVSFSRIHKKKTKSMGEAGMAVGKSIQTRVVGIIRYMLHPYCLSSNGVSVKTSRDVIGNIRAPAQYSRGQAVLGRVNYGRYLGSDRCGTEVLTNNLLLAGAGPASERLLTM